MHSSVRGMSSVPIMLSNPILVQHQVQATVASKHTVHWNLIHNEVAHGRFKILLTHVKNLLLDSSLREYVISEYFRIYLLNFGNLSPATIGRGLWTIFLHTHTHTNTHTHTHTHYMARCVNSIESTDIKFAVNSSVTKLITNHQESDNQLLVSHIWQICGTLAPKER